ncbi:hypothetical protein A2U01_0055142, partial [Trifolium medium]|nr:hypothetical protein [Trifolium medium]
MVEIVAIDKTDTGEADQEIVEFPK